MADIEARLRELIGRIAKDHGYDENNIDLKTISSEGENYSSRLFSGTLLSPGKDDLKLFCKAAILGEKIRSIFEIQLYEIEFTFYRKILPTFRNLEEKYNLLEKDRLVVPKYYGGSIDYSEELLILEDVTAKGFNTFDRFQCFDWNFASTCVGELAKFHALSVAFEKDDPEGYAKITSKLKINNRADYMKDLINISTKAAIESTDEIYKDRVVKFLRSEMKKESCQKFFNTERKIFLTHGDFRPSNILQTTDINGKLQVAIVDYQIINQGNPVTDLVFFLIWGSDEEFRANHLQQFFNHYYKTFSQCLQRFGINADDVYQKEDFHNDVKEMLPFGLTLATFVVLLITVEKDSAPKLEDDFDFGKLEIQANDQFKVRFNALVRDYVKWGIL